MNTVVYILGWWLFVGLVGYSVFAFMRWLSSPPFRNSVGDISTEVGYTEDSYGQTKRTDTHDAAVQSLSPTEEGFERAAHTAGPGM